MVVVDGLSKYAYFRALTHPYTGKKVVEVFVENIARLHEMPRSVISDQDPISISNFCFRELN